MTCCTLLGSYCLEGEFIDGISIAWKKGKYGRINVKDEIVTEFKFENIGINFGALMVGSPVSFGSLSLKETEIIEY